MLQVLYTDFGLTVIWDNSARVTVTLRKAAYFNNTCGLCGTCNDVPFDDFLTREGRLVSVCVELFILVLVKLDIFPLKSKINMEKDVYLHP